MTTIAFDGFDLAADRQVTDISSSIKHAGPSKLHVVSKYCVFAGVGQVSNVYAIRNWLVDTKKPSPADLSDDFHGILVEKPHGKRPLGVYTIQGTRCQIIPNGETKAAAGSGKEIALAVMALGHSAKKAIEVASSLDPYTGMGIDVVEIVKRKAVR